MFELDSEFDPSHCALDVRRARSAFAFGSAPSNGTLEAAGGDRGRFAFEVEFEPSHCVLLESPPDGLG